MSDDKVRDVPAEDTVGHGLRDGIRTQDDLPELEDAEGHRFVPVDERPAVGEVPASAPRRAAGDDDTEGHRVLT
jgi:hypothetical protein